MNHTDAALAALAQMFELDPTHSSAFIDTHRLAATATTNAMLAQAAATNRHTEVITALMATSMTNTQAKVLLEALTGIGNKMKPS